MPCTKWCWWIFFARSGPGSAAAAAAAFSTAFLMSPPLPSKRSASTLKSTSGASGVRGGWICTCQMRSRSTGPGISKSTCVRMRRSNAVFVSGETTASDSNGTP